MIRYNIYNKVLGLAVAALTFMACTETWDDHYDAASKGVNEGTIWQAIENNSNLSNFASVLKATGYDKSLASSQVFTVFAPTNESFSKADADAIIAVYNAEKGKVDDEENTAIKEFVQNHMALYNYSVSESHSDSIVLMNGKYASLTSDGIDKAKFLAGSKNQLYGNGLLFAVDKVLDYFPNVFEYFRKDADFDSVYNFLYNEKLYRSEFEPLLSVAGGIENGKTVYLDSVFRRTNDLFSYLGRLNSEDSTYWMVAPSNQVWEKLIDEYSQYFVYDAKAGDNLSVGDIDSLAYVNSRLAILNGTVFSRTINTDKMLQDSAMSTAACLEYNYRKAYWGADSLCYYQYFDPLQAGGVMSGTENFECSNGQVMKVSDLSNWNFDKKQTFFQNIIVEAERQGSIQDMSKIIDSKGDSVYTVNAAVCDVHSDSEFYNEVSNNTFVEFTPSVSTVNHTVTFNIENVLSNIGYDIYLVTAPALANDSNATSVQRLPTILRATINYHDETGKSVSTQLQASVKTDDASLGYHPDSVNYIKLNADKDYPEGFKFPVSSYGLVEEKAQVNLNVETRVTATQQRNNQYTRTMRIDCIILKPHEPTKSE